MTDCNIAIIGAGAMGGAVADGLLRAGAHPSHIALANPHPARLARFTEAGVRTYLDNRNAVGGADLVIFAVKPWILPDVVRELRSDIDYDRQEVTAIVAGVGCKELCDMMKEAGGKLPALSVSMPNTAVALGESMTFVVAAHGRPSRAVELFGALGKVMEIPEKQLGAATALASCGIAYAMRYVRAAEEGGVELGFRAADARQIVVETLRGAAALLSRDGAHPEAEIDKVTTPGGLTIRGLNAMEEAGFTASVIAGLKASQPR